MLLRFAKKSLVEVNAFSCTREKKMHNFTFFSLVQLNVLTSTNDLLANHNGIVGLPKSVV